MAGDRKFTRIPPESSGDRIKMKHTAVVPFDQKDTSHNWIVGGLYTIDGQSASTITAELLGYDQGGNAYTGLLYVKYDSNNEYNNVDAEDDQNIKDPDGNIVAYVNGTPYATYVNTTHIVGDNNPENAVNVDRFGGLYTRFSEGAPELSAYNKLRITEPTLIAQYDFSEQSLRSQFATSQEGSGETIWQPDFGHIKISSYLSGDRATYTSSLWHPCPAGAGVLFILSARCSSLGTSTDGTLRFWGAFDATDGAFFALAQGALSVRHRWTINGTTSNMAINQSDWSEDTLDGTGGVTNPSGMNLDPTKNNLYWVDFQNYGGGRIRWGVFYQGERIVCHIMDMSNGSMPGNVLYNAYGNPNRPICWSCAKRDSNVLPGASPDPLQEESIYAYGGAVYYEAGGDLLDEGSYRQSADNYELDFDSTSTTYLMTLRPQATNSEIDAAISNGIASYTGENHTLYAPQQLEVTAVGNRIQITDADVSTGTLTVTTNTPHYLSVDDKVDVYGTTTVNGRFTVSSITSPTIFVCNSTGLSDTTNETGELVGPKDGDVDSRMVEIRLFQKCIMRGTSFEKINYTTVEKDEYGHHLAHGPEFSRFVVDGRYTHEFFQYFNKMQNGSVRNASDQSFARSFQSLVSLVGDDDRYSTGVQRVRAQVGPHPVFGTTLHYFDDKGKVIIRRFERDGVNSKVFDNTNYTGIKITEGDFHYLSFIDRDEAWLYNSEADIDDDRSVRVVTVSSTTNILAGDTFTVGTGQAFVKGIATINGTEYVYFEGRNANFDTAFVNTASFTTTSGGSGTLTIDPLTSSDRIGGTGDFSGWDLGDERTTFDLDYKTSLLAIDSSAWLVSNHDIVVESSPEVIGLYGPDAFQPAWTFMARNLEPHKTDTTLRLNMSWKERVQ